MATTASQADEPPAPVFRKRGLAAKGNLRKRVRKDSTSESSDEEVPRHNLKQKKPNSGVPATSLTGRKIANEEPPAIDHTPGIKPAALTKSDNATKQSHWFDEDPKTNGGAADAEATSNKLAVPYKGMPGQSSVNSNPGPSQSKSIGPVKAAPSNVRMTTMIDYAPDVCKDYRLTGYCGFGDNCKFLHDRSDYKQGWQLDKEWENVTKNKKIEGTVFSSASAKRAGANNEDEDDIPEDIPFACIICKETYKSPIVTRCGHYFCEKCALDRYKKDPNCAACGSGTNGIFNSAKKLARQIDKIRKGG